MKIIQLSNNFKIYWKAEEYFRPFPYLTKGHHASRGRGGIELCDTLYKVVNETVIFNVTEGGGGSNLGQICVTSFMNAP